MSPEDKLTRDWVERFVVGLNLCPFAARPLHRGLVHFETCPAHDAEAAFYWAGARVQWQLNQPASQVETSLLVFPRGLDRFELFLGFVEDIEYLLDESGAADFIQLAHFHPRYHFNEVRENDPANATNRSPFPTVQLLRTESVARAVREYPDIEEIPARNIALLRGREPFTDE
ncbi:DUF1415 family protein [Lewinella sp. JB7]|uniref:DUF1415 family protein n=1 Tax=Lewinella sp. JB7 TaxID=2962887 RepID=UPI0020C9CF24|nr:DUF1415 domain-containing protein [Lewinella sp. JB7]MCP9235497.1 DUF1415 domain-containing protein [Lewinella sp. JB7]